MRKRTKAREYALQVLYKIDVTSDAADKALEEFWQDVETDVEPDIKDFAGRLVTGVVEKLSAIDASIGQFAQNWQLSRMAVVDRNILRIGCFELQFCDDVPPKVSINEAIDLAKKYSGVEAGKFVNGILDKIKSSKDSA